MEDGQVMEIVSDNTWKVAPNTARSWKQKTHAWKQWPAATVLSTFPAAPPTQVYYAPVSHPVEIAFWQRGWFQISLLLVAGVSFVTGLFLASRLLLQSQMEKVVRRERARIAVDLHDGLGGGLTQLVLFGEKSRRDVPEDSQEAATLARLSEQSRGLLREMNETVWLINSQRDTFRDFASYIVKYAETFFQNSPVRCLFDIEDDLPPLPCDLGIRRNLFMAAKEAMNNILRHSQAAVAVIGIHRQRQDLIVMFCDDGCGFNPAATNGGNGLRNMKQRVSEAVGQFRIESRAGGGTVIEFRVPLYAQARLGIARLFSWNRKRAGA
jgi:signal transduction histidine kinase